MRRLLPEVPRGGSGLVESESFGARDELDVVRQRIPGENSTYGCNVRVLQVQHLLRFGIIGGGRLYLYTDRRQLGRSRCVPRSVPRRLACWGIIIGIGRTAQRSQRPRGWAGVPGRPSAYSAQRRRRRRRGQGHGGDPLVSTVGWVSDVCGRGGAVGSIKISVFLKCALTITDGSCRRRGVRACGSGRSMGIWGVGIRGGRTRDTGSVPDEIWDIFGEH